jgi:hypothetical protein
VGTQKCIQELMTLAALAILIQISSHTHHVMRKVLDHDSPSNRQRESEDHRREKNAFCAARIAFDLTRCAVETDYLRYATARRRVQRIWKKSTGLRECECGKMRHKDHSPAERIQMH